MEKWKPRIGAGYFTVNSVMEGYKFVYSVEIRIWRDTKEDFQRYRSHNVFRFDSEAMERAEILRFRYKQYHPEVCFGGPYFFIRATVAEEGVDYEIEEYTWECSKEDLIREALGTVCATKEDAYTWISLQRRLDNPDESKCIKLPFDICAEDFETNQ